MSQRSLRGRVPVATALAAMIGCLLPAPASAATVSSAAVSSAAVPAAFAAPAITMPVSTVPGLSSEWWLSALSVPQAWKSAATGTGKPGNGVTVAVVSTGVDATAPDLAGDVVTGPDESGSGRAPGSEFWGVEGTAVASLIAGHGHGHGGTEGITGIAPGARILSVRATLEYNDPLNGQASITRGLPNAIAAGIRYAVSHGAGVIALPLDPGTLGPPTTGDPVAAGGSAAERAAVASALAHNVVLIAPAGDNGAGPGTVNYPAAYHGVVAVGATQRSGGLAPYTSRRPYAALTAPGSGLMAAAPGGGYDALASTDMSAALTAGVAALIRSRFPRLSAAQVAGALEHGTAPASTRSKPAAQPVPGAGSGALNAERALREAAAIAAGSPGASPGPRSASALRPAGTATPNAGTTQASLGAEAGSALRDAAIGAGGLIAVLVIALLVLTGMRRRRMRDTRPRPPGAARARPGSDRAAAGPAHAGHAPPGTHAAPGGRAPHEARTLHDRHEAPEQGTSRQAQPSGEKRASVARHTRSRHRNAEGREPREDGTASRSPQPQDDPWTPARPAESTSAGTGAAPGEGRRNRPRIIPVAKTGATGPSARLRRARKAASDKPPWEPAPMPATEPEPAPPASQKSAPPWEQAPGQLAAAPVPADLADWPPGAPVNTGPMYVWNPATTGPIPPIETPPAEDGDKGKGEQA